MKIRGRNHTTLTEATLNAKKVVTEEMGQTIHRVRIIRAHAMRAHVPNNAAVIRQPFHLTNQLVPENVAMAQSRSRKVPAKISHRNLLYIPTL